jgi:tetratricopeptide (TPR) repeat protein
LRAAVRKILHTYGAPLGMFLFFMLAALYVYMGRINRATPDFPRTASDFMQAAKAERRLSELQAVLAANPDDMQALAEAGRLKYQLGAPRYIEAIADLERARGLGLADARSFYYLGVMYQAAGLYDFAAQEYRKFLNNFPADAEARMLLAKLCYAAGDFPGAVREYELLLKESKTDPVLLENLALARWKNKQDYSQALSDMRAQGPAGAFLADYAEGRINYELKDYPRAASFLKKAADAAGASGGFTDQAALLWLAGDAAYKSKDTDGAYDYMQRLVALNPAHEEGRSLLAKLEKARKAAAKKKK